MIHLRTLFVVCLVLLPGCGIGGWHISIFRNRVPFTAMFRNSEGLQLAYRVRLPAYAPGEKSKRPLLVYIDGSGKVPLDLTRDQILAHFQSRGFVAAMKQKRGVSLSEGKFKRLTFEQRIQDNLDFIGFLEKTYSQIDRTQVYIMGHSEGAAVAAEVAHRNEGTAGLIWASAGFGEDFYDLILSHHPRQWKKMQEIRDGKSLDGTWQSRSRRYWYQRFNHESMPLLDNAPYPVLFIIGDQDEAYRSFTARVEKLQKTGRTEMSHQVFPQTGHGTIAGASQQLLLATIDNWMTAMSSGCTCGASSE